MSTLPSPCPQSGWLAGYAPRAGKPLGARAPPLFKSAGGGSVAPGRAVPGGSVRAVRGNYRKCREKPWSFPIWSWRRRRARCRWPGGAEPGAERGRGDSTRLCRASALSPSRAGWARGPAPAPLGWPRPAPPLRELPSAPRELGPFEPPLGLLWPPSTTPSPGASPLIPRAAAPRRVPPQWQRDRTRQFRGSSDCLM